MSELLDRRIDARTSDVASGSRTREIVERIDIAASASRVFQALTSPTELLAWWGDRQTFPSTHWALDLRVGGKWLSRWRAPDGSSFALGGEILELRPPHCLVYSWWDERYPGLPLTTVRYDIEEREGGVTVTVTHSGFDAVRPDYDDYHGGWPTVARKLRAHAESREVFRANRDLAIEVEDLVAAEAFYAGTLGFALRSRSATQLELDAGSFSLWVNRSSTGRLPFIPSLDATDLRAARRALEEAGCRILRESPDGAGFDFEDPFGFVIDVMAIGRG